MYCLSLIESHSLWKQSFEASRCVELIGRLLLLMNGLLIMEAKVLKTYHQGQNMQRKAFWKCW